jgi:AcrR family transcriptional regulator
MTEAGSRVAARRAAVEREILDAAWAQMGDEGVAAISAREVARSVGLRQQSLTYYFPTKQDLLDALFADGFADLRLVFDELPEGRDPVDAVVAVGEAVVGYFTAHPARYHLMFQRTVPGFTPSNESHAVALRCLQVLVDRLAAAGVTDPDDIALVRGVISGLAAEQIANDPGGRQFVRQVGRGVRAVLASLHQEYDRPKVRRKRHR